MRTEWGVTRLAALYWGALIVALLEFKLAHSENNTLVIMRLLAGAVVSSLSGAMMALLEVIADNQSFCGKIVANRVVSR
jgi:ABC-type Fe3+-siderophore transport system permease subunit